MIESMQGAYNAVVGGLDILKGFQALKTEAAVNQAIIDIQRSLLEAQRALNEAEARHASDLSRIRDLEQCVVRLENWESEKQRYELADTGQGSPAYRLKAGMERGEPTHWLCPQCYEQNVKSIMKQDNLPQGRVQVLACQRCKNEIITEGRRIGEGSTVKR